MKMRKVQYWICLLVLVPAMLLLASCSRQNLSVPVSSSASSGEESEIVSETAVEMIDADQYYRENGQLLSSFDMNQSGAMLTEAQVSRLLEERGFTQFSAVYSCDSQGNVIDETEISSNSDNMHPIYEVYYTSSEGILWIITVISDRILANPISFNLESEKPAMLILTEDENVMSYDSASKRFFVTVPSESALLTMRVNRIDSITLDQMTTEELNK